MVRKNYTIVGVASSRFAWGDGDVYLPKKITQDPTLGYYVGIRLKPGVTHAQADAAASGRELDAFGQFGGQHRLDGTAAGRSFNAARHILDGETAAAGSNMRRSLELLHADRTASR